MNFMNNGIDYVHDDIINEIIDSDCEKSWIESVSINGTSIYIYRTDVRLRIEQNPPTGFGPEKRRFTADWATSLSDDQAHREFFQIYFNATCIKEVMLVSVGEEQTCVPVPVSPKNLEVKRPIDLAVARIVHDGNLDKYLKRMGFKFK